MIARLARRRNLKGEMRHCPYCRKKTPQIRAPGGQWVCQRCLNYC